MSSEPIDLVSDGATSPPKDDERKSALTRFKEFWDREVKVRVKALIYTSLVLAILVAGNQVQTFQINSQRIQDVADRQSALCDTRIQSRKDLREILFYVVDLSDVLPSSDAAMLYTQNRVAFIDTKYPELARADCD